MTDPETLARQRGYPAMAHRVVAVDFDGTLFPWGYLDDEPEPLPGAVDAVCRLHSHKYRVTIFTSRLSRAWLEQSGYTEWEMRERIERALRKYGIPFDEITGEKVAAAHYIDDRALRFQPGEWPALVDFILWKDADVD